MTPDVLVLVHPESAAASVSRTLESLGCIAKVVDDASGAGELEPASGWPCAVVSLVDHPERALSVARWLRAREEPTTTILALVNADLLHELSSHTDLFDDFCLTPFHPAELEARLDHLLIRAEPVDDADIISYGPLRLNVETYQAVVDDRALDLTYMEYELLRYLAAQPGKVFSREVLLSEVWGYDYYGGARTVDVHVRRLRSKLGEEHANLISTVRSVGYRLGQADWSQ
ncbi:MAG: winged helix-turn-helix domain-containing protein [Acidimicrobiales bacterium]